MREHIPLLIQRMENKLNSAIKKNPDKDFSEQKVIIHEFKEIYNDAEYYSRETVNLMKDNKRLKDIIVSQHNKRMKLECQINNLKLEIEAKEF